jgi:putative acetyltransferase
MLIKTELSMHAAAIGNLLRDAFPTPEEAELVEHLRELDALRVSLVALDADVVIGHIAFSPVTVNPHNPAVSLLALAPLAVPPVAQGKGVGSELVMAGLRACSRLGCDGVVVLGDPKFYQRFGFRPATECGLRCLFDAPSDAFMIAELRDLHHLGGGGVRFHGAFDRFLPPDS